MLDVSRNGQNLWVFSAKWIAKISEYRWGITPKWRLGRGLFCAASIAMLVYDIQNNDQSRSRVVLLFVKICSKKFVILNRKAMA